MDDALQETIEVVRRVRDGEPSDVRQFAASVLRGLEEAQRGECISHDEVKRRFASWLQSGHAADLLKTDE